MDYSGNMAKYFPSSINPSNGAQNSGFSGYNFGSRNPSGGSDLSNKMLAGGAIGGGLASLMSLFGDNENPFDDASEYYNQIPGMMKGYSEPYIDAGKKMMPDLTKTYSDLMNDPGSLISRIGGGYQKSPGFDFERNEGLQGINNAAAAGGMLGTASHQQEAGNLSTQLANKDFENYMRQALGAWGQGLQGKEGINKMGFDASTGLAENLAQALMSKGNLAYSDAASRNQQKGDIFSSLGAAIPAAMSLL